MTSKKKRNGREREVAFLCIWKYLTRADNLLNENGWRRREKCQRNVFNRLHKCDRWVSMSLGFWLFHYESSHRTMYIIWCVFRFSSSYSLVCRLAMLWSDLLEGDLANIWKFASQMLVRNMNKVHFNRCVYLFQQF